MSYLDSFPLSCFVFLFRYCGCAGFFCLMQENMVFFGEWGALEGVLVGA